MPCNEVEVDNPGEVRTMLEVDVFMGEVGNDDEDDDVDSLLSGSSVATIVEAGDSELSSFA